MSTDHLSADETPVEALLMAVVPTWDNEGPAAKRIWRGFARDLADGYRLGLAAGRTAEDVRILAIVAAEPWLLHRPVECVNVRCKEGRWCIGCDPNGETDCAEHPWPCPVVREQNPAWAAGRKQAAADALAKIAASIGASDPAEVEDHQLISFGHIRRHLAEGGEPRG